MPGIHDRLSDCFCLRSIVQYLAGVFRTVMYICRCQVYLLDADVRRVPYAISGLVAALALPLKAAGVDQVGDLGIAAPYPRPQRGRRHPLGEHVPVIGLQLYAITHR